jgi:hypothetical protein
MVSRSPNHLSSARPDKPYVDADLLDQIRRALSPVPEASPPTSIEHRTTGLPQHDMLSDRFGLHYPSKPASPAERPTEFETELAHSLHRCHFQRLDGFRYQGADRTAEVMHAYKCLRNDCDAVRQLYARWFDTLLASARRYREELTDTLRLTPAPPPTWQDDWDQLVEPICLASTDDLIGALTRQQFDTAADAAELLSFVMRLRSESCINLSRAIVGALRWGVDHQIFALIRWNRKERKATFQYWTHEVVTESATEEIHDTSTRPGLLASRKQTVHRQETDHTHTNQIVFHQSSLFEVVRYEYLDALNAPALTIPTEIEKLAMLEAPESIRPFLSVFEGRQPFELRIARDVSTQTATDVAHIATETRTEPGILTESFHSVFPADPALVIGNNWVIAGWNQDDIRAEIERRKNVRARQRELATVRETRQLRESAYQTRVREATPERRAVPTVAVVALSPGLFGLLYAFHDALPLEVHHSALIILASVVCSAMVVYRRITAWLSLPDLRRLHTAYQADDTGLAADELRLQRELAALGEGTPLKSPDSNSDRR